MASLTYFPNPPDGSVRIAADSLAEGDIILESGKRLKVVDATIECERADCILQDCATGGIMTATYDKDFVRIEWRPLARDVQQEQA
jgi:hypothetical protein